MLTSTRQVGADPEINVNLRSSTYLWIGVVWVPSVTSPLDPVCLYKHFCPLGLSSPGLVPQSLIVHGVYYFVLNCTMYME